MKKTLFILLLFCTIPVLAQEETLFSGEVESGGFGGPVIKVTTINGENAMLVGGRGGWLINHSFVLGGGGYGLVTNVNAKVQDADHQYMEVGYGGLDLEYISSPYELLHLSIGVLIGGGGVNYKHNDNEMFNDSHRSDSFFVLEPSVQANLNVTHFFRLAAGVSYRYVGGLKSILTTNNDLSGPSGILTLEFGTF